MAAHAARKVVASPIEPKLKNWKTEFLTDMEGGYRWDLQKVFQFFVFQFSVFLFFQCMQFVLLAYTYFTCTLTKFSQISYPSQKSTFFSYAQMTGDMCTSCEVDSFGGYHIYVYI